MLASARYTVWASPLPLGANVDQRLTQRLERQRPELRDGQAAVHLIQRREGTLHLVLAARGLPVLEAVALGVLAVRQDEFVDGRAMRVAGWRGVTAQFPLADETAENELVPVEVYHRIQAVSGLRKGRSEARESEPVVPAPEEQIEAVIAHVARPVAAMIQLKRFTGMRPNEVVIMRLCDIDRSGKVWIYTPCIRNSDGFVGSALWTAAVLGETC